MMIEVNIVEDEILGWREVLLVLAIDRWQPLLADLGVPAPIAAAPLSIHGEAGRCWQIKLALHQVRSHGREDYRLMIEAMVRDFLAHVASAYSESLATELHRWALRQYVDDAQRHAYQLWSQVLRRLADVAGLGYPRVPIPLSPDDFEHMKRTVETRLSIELERSDAARLAAAAAAPASPLERQIAAQEPDLVESVQESLQEALTNQRAYRALCEILDGLDASAHPVFLDWARQQATAMEMPSHLLAFPPSASSR